MAYPDPRIRIRNSATLAPDYYSGNGDQIGEWLGNIPIGQAEVINDVAVLRKSNGQFHIEKRKRTMNPFDAARFLASKHKGAR